MDDPRSDAPACALGFDADVAADMLGREPGDGEARAFADHARSCASCRSAAETWSLVRGAWRAEIDRDEQYERAESERRLTARWPRRTGVPWPLACAGAAVAALIAVWATAPRTGLTTAPRESTIQGSAVDASASAVPAPTSATAAIPTAVRAPRALFAVRACVACGGLTAGEPMNDRGDVVVPRGSTLSLNWGIDASLVDAASGVDVAGPAVVRADDAALMLESGTAHAHVVDVGEVATASAVTRGTSSTWEVAVEGVEQNRVTVARGEVEVRAGAARELLHAGESLDAFADGRLVRPSLALAATTAPVQAAREPAPAVTHADRGTRERASFALAEVELAHGEADHARSLLAALLDAGDPSLAGDAAFLLAGSMPTPRERLEVIDRYLSKRRPSPYAEQAEVERARALLEAGRTADARALVRTLRARPNFPTVGGASLARIERALDASNTVDPKN